MKPAMSFTVKLPHHPDSIPTARRAVDGLRDDVDDVTLRNARLLVSELVTNVIRHVPESPGYDQIVLTVDRRDDHVRIEVCDRGSGFTPVPRVDRQDQGSGWGLHILAQLATRWGVQSDGGTRVWFELETAAARTQRAPQSSAA